ncbi:MAG: glycoside hydrolase domain-containing protein [Lachnospiraceae bacterium]
MDLGQPTTEETDTQIQIWQHPFSVANYYGVAEKDYFTEEHFKYMRASMIEYQELGGRDVVANIVEEAWNHQSYYGDPSMVK